MDTLSKSRLGKLDLLMQRGNPVERAKRGGKSLEMKIKIWWDPKARTIHMRGEGQPAFFLSTVSANPGHKRGHPHLFYQLTKCLRNVGAPAPEVAEK